MSDLDIDPFSPVPVPAPALPAVVTGQDKLFQMVDASGMVIECKMESGVLVKIRKIGPLKQQIRLAIYNAALQPAKEKAPEEIAQMSHVEAAAYHLARAASQGSLDAVDMLLDRLIGKPKQTSESVRVNMNVDEFLTAEESETPVHELKEIPTTEEDQFE